MAKNHVSMSSLTDLHINKFYSLIDQTNPEDCWEWKGRLSPSSKIHNNKLVKREYGIYSIRIGKEVRGLQSHRIAYFLYYKKDPGDLLVCHSCNNRKCCNPHHLFLGTHQDNMTDMKSKNRGAIGTRNGSATHPESIKRGEENNMAKLTETQVIEIRLLKEKPGYTSDILSKMFNVCPSAIRHICNRRNWKHLK